MKVRELQVLLDHEDPEAEALVVRVDLSGRVTDTKPVFGVRTGAAGVAVESC